MGKTKQGPGREKSRHLMSFDHLHRDILKEVFALRFMGKSEDEIIEYLEEKYGKLG